MYKVYIILISILLFYFLNNYIKSLITYFTYKKKFSSELLNNELYKICNILNIENVNGWFIGYGTLLGIIRNKSCIDRDDDIDIVIDIKNKYLIDMIIKKYNFKMYLNKKNFYSIYKNPNSPLIDFYSIFMDNIVNIDFYFCDVDNLGNYEDSWEKVVWTNVNPIKKLKWNNTILNIPNDYEKKLINRYGENWRTPIHNYKGVKNKYL